MSDLGVGFALVGGCLGLSALVYALLLWHGRRRYKIGGDA